MTSFVFLEICLPLSFTSSLPTAAVTLKMKDIIRSNITWLERCHRGADCACEWLYQFNTSLSHKMFLTIEELLLAPEEHLNQRFFSTSQPFKNHWSTVFTWEEVFSLASDDLSSWQTSERDERKTSCLLRGWDSGVSLCKCSLQAPNTHVHTCTFIQNTETNNVHAHSRTLPHHLLRSTNHPSNQGFTQQPLSAEWALPSSSVPASSRLVSDTDVK